MNILGIWDGHDSGAALLMDGRLVCAINEERLTGRKLEIMFPRLAIAECLREGGIKPHDIHQVACATFDPAKTLTRLWPQSKERYYRVRRRMDLPSPMNRFTKVIKYRLTELPPNRLTHWLSNRVVLGCLKEVGFDNPNLVMLDHHLCHAAGAAYGSGFAKAVVITLDGVGDGLSGSISLLSDGRLQRISSIEARHSLGIFFEHVTNLLHMRELEDEGKVMALADFALPVKEHQNPLLEMFQIEGLQVRARYHANELYRRLADVLWRCTPEQFAAMAQQTLEKRVLELVRNAVAQTKVNRVALSGGVFANVKLNGMVRNLPGLEGCYVFPHMGDGGLALGAATQLSQSATQTWPNLYLGPDYSAEEIQETVHKSGLSYRKPDDLIGATVELIGSGKIVGWFQGRMEYAPRALGGRSVLALPGLPNIRDLLNLKLKKRSWFQPFCPSMLDEEAKRLLADCHGPPDRFMTSIYQVRPEFRELLSGVTSRDGSCRPQMVARDESRYSRLLVAIQEKTGCGVLLNTSFNAHGAPMACSPTDALGAFAAMGIDHLILGDWILEK
ncbi:MAG: hypothetical protein H7839_12180 [Magnetococcus sp. YQC-5]